MVRSAFAVIVAFASVALAGCGGKPPPGAAETAHQLLAAAVADDRVAFEAVVDRVAVRDDLRRQIVERGREAGLEVDGGPSDFLLDRMISPGALKLVRADTGERIGEAPSADQLEPRIKSLGQARACLNDLEDADRCLLTFEKSKTGWRLVGMQAMDLTIPLA